MAAKEHWQWCKALMFMLLDGSPTAESQAIFWYSQGI